MTTIARTERGERKRRDVLDATLRVLAREGPRAVTHRAVALEVGTSVRATTYYFESREALLEAALRHYAGRAMARFDEIAALFVAQPATRGTPRKEETVRLAASLLTASIASDLADPVGGLVAEIELILEIARRPALEDAYAAWQTKLEGMLEAHARSLGSPSPALDARLVLATLRGLELEALARPSRRRSETELHDVFARLLAAISPASPRRERRR